MIHKYNNTNFINWYNLTLSLDNFYFKNWEGFPQIQKERDIKKKIDKNQDHV